MAGIALSLTFCLSSCGLTGILRADFDQFQVLDPPLFIPGDPVGDQITAVQSAWESESGSPEGEFLQISGSADFVVADHDLPDEYQITIQGAIDIANFSPMRIRFMDKDGNNALVIERDGGHFHILSGNEFEPPTLEIEFGHVQEITVIIRTKGIDPVDISISYFEQDDLGHKKLEIRDEDFGKLDRIRIVGSTSSPYLLDKISAYTRNN